MSDLTDTKLLWFLKGNRKKIYKQIVSDTEKGESGLPSKADVQATARELAELIQATGETTATSAGALVHNMSINKLSTADLDPSMAPQFGLTYDPITGKFMTANGIYYDSILAKIQADAYSISEEWSRTTTTSLQTTINGITSGLTEITNLVNGEIRRGFIDVIEGGQTRTYFGIAIASRELFSANAESRSITDEDNVTHTYYQIDTGQCFGLYTATGWQFWVNGQKIGWFDTSDRQLHVGSINIESNLQMDQWRLIVNGTRFGIKYVGA